MTTPERAASASTQGPWALVMGMHRSGTSAVTGAMGALGFQAVRPQDRLSSHSSNPEHWESLSSLRHNDAILEHFGGTWDAPPELPAGWESGQGLPGVSAAEKVLATAYPDPGPSVWKDPRLCLLLPYWRSVIGNHVAAVLVWRAPLAVARSLHRRDGLPVPYGIALWERYMRSAVTNLAQTDVYVLDYDAMVEDPALALSGLTSWLSSVGIFGDIARWDPEPALSSVTADLRHESAASGDDEQLLLVEQHQLVEYLAGAAGAHRALPPPPGAESAWTTALLGARDGRSLLECRALERRLAHCEGERDWYVSALDESRHHLASLQASSSWRLTAPVRFAAARLRRRT